MLNFIANWRRRRETIRELSLLSDRELADLGVFRADIPTLARLGTDVQRDEIENILGPVYLAPLDDAALETVAPRKLAA